MPKFDLTVVPPDGHKAKNVKVAFDTEGEIKQTPEKSPNKAESVHMSVLNLKAKVAKALGVKVDDLVLYFQNPSGPLSYRLQHLAEDLSLKALGVDTKATIKCQLKSYDNKDSKGVASPYYMWNDFSQNVPSEIRVQGAGEPKQLSKDKAEDAKATSPKSFITKYSWVDDSRREVKIYVDKAGEPAVVEAAGSGGTLEAKFEEQSFCITVPGETMTYVFKIAELEYPIIPEECKVKVSRGKKISITLAKASEDTIWHTLLYRR
jgi:hypothetical protein